MLQPESYKKAKWRLLVCLVVMASVSGPIYGQEIPWRPNPVVRYWDLNINPLEFRSPIHLIPYDLKAGLILYGGPDMFTGFPLGLIRQDDSIVLLDSTESAMATVAPLYNRFSLVYDLELFKVNLRSRFWPVSVVDVMIGLGLRTNQIPYAPALPENWPAAGSAYRFAPIFHQGLINVTLNYQWAEDRFAYLQLTRGLGVGSAYRANIVDRYLKGRGQVSDIMVGFKLFRNRLGSVRLVMGGELRYQRFDAPRLNDPLKLTPVEGIRMRSLGVFFTLGVALGGEPSTADKAKREFYAGDYMSAAENFRAFLADYPKHTKRRRAERLLDKAEELIPFQQIHLARTAQDEGRYEDALAWYRRAETRGVSSLEDTIAVGRMEIGYVYLKDVDSLLTLGDLENTSQLLNTTRQLLPEEEDLVERYTAEILIQQGHQLRGTGSWNASLRRYDEAMRFDTTRRVEIEGYKVRLAEDLLKEATVAADQLALQLALESLRLSQSLDPRRRSEIDALVTQLERRLDRMIQGEIRRQMERQMQEVRELRQQLPPSRPRLGMLVVPVEDVLGKPDHVTQQTDRFGVNHQLWEYQGGEYPGLYYFEDYILVRIESLP